jgi:glyoxylase-like metal-dependent hydrolase (beta-lactamase superfamily II)
MASIGMTGVIAATRPSGGARLSVLDVGQGDAILVEGGRGGRLLVDGGPDPDRLLVALDARLPPWDRRIDAIVLTHPHEDHVAGLVLILERYAVGAVFATPMIGPGEFQPVRNVVVYRALPFTIRIAAIDTAAGLRGGVGTIVMTVDLTVVLDPFFGRLLVRVTPRYFKKLEWMFCHSCYAARRSDSIRELSSAAFGFTSQNFGRKLR